MESTAMKKDVILFIAILNCICGICSCDEWNENRNIAKSEKVTIQREIPLRNGAVDKNYIRTKDKANQMQLDAIDEVGYDSLQIRVWLNYSLARDKQLLVFKKSKSGWFGQFFTFEIDRKSTPNYHRVVDKKIASIIPKSGWDNLITNLNKYRINSLSSDSSGGADGTTYCVEVATEKKYRFFRIWSPEYRQHTNPDADNMVKILQLLENEFNFKRIQE
jgi:hypothetical protein